MAQTIKLKRSSTSGRIPTTSDLALGEVAINTYDGKMYIKKNVGGTESIVEIGGSSGTVTDAFKTIAVLLLLSRDMELLMLLMVRLAL